MVGSSAVTRLGVALLALSPVAVLPGALDRFTLPKAAVGVIGATLVLTVPGRPVPRRLRWVLAAAAVVMVVAAMLGASPVAQLFGRAPRYEGIVVGAAYLLAFLAGTRLFSPGMAGLQRWFAQWFGLGAIVMAAIALAEVSGIRVVTSEGWRSGSLVGNATELGAYGVLVLGFLGFRALRERDGWSTAGALAAMVCIVLSGSRGALVGALVTLVVLALVVFRRERVVLLIGGFALVAGGLAVPLTRGRLTGTSPLAASTVTGRLDTWEATWALVKARPLGVGPNGFMDSVPRVLTADWYRNQPADLVLDSPHSLVLQLWAAGGPVLLVLFGIGVALLTVAALPRLRLIRITRQEAPSRSGTADGSAAAVLGLPGYLAVLLTHFTGPTTTLVAVALAGAAVPLAAVPARRRTPSRQVTAPGPARGGRGAVGLGAALSVVLVTGAVAEIPLRSAIVALQHGDSPAAERSFAATMLLRPWTRGDTALTALHACAAAGRNGRADLAARGQHWIADAGPVLHHSPVGLGDAGAVAEAAGDLAAADGHFTAARKLAPYDPLLLLRSGVVAAELGDHERAEGLFLRAASIVPNSPDPWQNLAILYGQLGRSSDQQRATAEADRLASRR